MPLYQPRIKDHLIRKLYFTAKREGKKMTHLINDIVEAYFIDEPEPPLYPERKSVTNEMHPHTLQRKLRRFARRIQQDHRETGGTDEPNNQAYDRLHSTTLPNG